MCQCMPVCARVVVLASLVNIPGFLAVHALISYHTISCPRSHPPLAPQDNGLAERLPPTLFSLTSLAYLELGQNRFNGTLPTGLAALTNLEYLSLYNNQVRIDPNPCPCPNPHCCLFVCRAVPPLLIWTSRDTIPQFSGPIPTELSALKKLQLLDLQNNAINGQVRPSLSLFHTHHVSPISLTTHQIPTARCARAPLYHTHHGSPKSLTTHHSPLTVLYGQVRCEISLVWGQPAAHSY